MFKFGEDWASFSKQLDEGRVKEAQGLQLLKSIPVAVPTRCNRFVCCRPAG